MIIGRKRENMNQKLVDRFSNKHLIVEESRNSRFVHGDRKKIMEAAFTKDYEFFSKESLSKLLRKAMYQINFDATLKHLLFCSINALLCELYHVPDKSNLLKENEQKLIDLFELMVFLGDSETNGFLHDETEGGWHHPETVNDYKPPTEGGWYDPATVNVPKPPTEGV